MSDEYGDWVDWLLCLGVAILLGANLPMRNPEGHSPRYWRRHPGESGVQPTPSEPERSNRGESGARSIWSHILGWPVVGVLGPGLVVLGFGVLGMSPPETRFAQGCFAVGYLVILVKIAWWVADDRDDPVPDRVVFIAVVFAAVGVSWFFSNLFATRKTAAANNQPIPAAISKGNSKVTINNSYLAAHPLVSQDDSRITANNVAWGDDDTAAAALWVRTVQQAKGDNHKLEALIKVRHDQCVKAWQGLSEEQRRRKMESLESDENLIRTELESR